MFSSCIGSFGLSSKLLSWNKTIGDSWTNELVFLCLWIIPAYEVTTIVDVLILNTIEFWSNYNPAMSNVTKTVKTDKGLFTVQTTDKGHKIAKEGSDEIVEFRFNKEEHSWSLITDDTTTKLLQFVDDRHANVYLADGSTMTVAADQAGVLALKQVMSSTKYFANK
ncbi:membrane protein [Bacteroidia bacterium]|nr:membrane protein [Bacteroidia bacterium]